MRKGLVLLIALALVVFSIQGAAAANFTMSWGFKIFGNPNARQVALNLAEKQANLEKGEESELDVFVEGLKRRLMSEVYREIIKDIFDGDGPGSGQYYAGHLVITVDTNEDGRTVVIIEDTVTGEVSIIELSDYWGMGF